MPPASAMLVGNDTFHDSAFLMMAGANSTPPQSPMRLGMVQQQQQQQYRSSFSESVGGGGYVETTRMLTPTRTSPATATTRNYNNSSSPPKTPPQNHNNNTNSHYRCRSTKSFPYLTQFSRNNSPNTRVNTPGLDNSSIHSSNRSPRTTTMIQSMTAPIVERHKKSNSLVGFDPLLISSDSNINNLSLQISSSSLSISPLTAAAPLMMTMEANKDLESELRKLARLFDLTIPSPNKEDEKLDLSNHGSKKSKSLWRSSKRGHRRAKSENNSSGKLNVFKEIMQNSSERRIAMDKKSSRNRDKTPPGSPNPADVARPVMAVSMPNSPMIQDLYKVVTASPEFSLSIPCLSKPAPTSFLTGREVVRTSEQEPSLFQMEIPEASEFLVSV